MIYEVEVSEQADSGDYQIIDMKLPFAGDIVRTTSVRRLNKLYSSNCTQQLRRKDLPIMSKTVCLHLYPATMYFQN